MLIRLLIFALIVSPPSWSLAKSCGKMTKELEELRMEYKALAENNSSKTGSVTFEGLCEILDKIVELKNAMIKAGCPKIPSRKPRPRTDRDTRPRL